jgi:phosphoglycolate phosphatase-like HAD superfamily hydrolase
MRFIIEFEGPIVDVADVYYRLHRDIATELGWSRLDQSTFWRITRREGRGANVLPGAKPAKVKKYHMRFAERLDSDAAVEGYQPQPAIDGALAALSRYGACTTVTIGANAGARQRVLDRANLSSHFLRAQSLAVDPRRRPGELRALAEGDERTVVAGASEAVIRAAAAADLFAVGITSGPCTATRLHRAGAAIVYNDLQELAASLSAGAEDMLRVGLLPPPLDR